MASRPSVLGALSRVPWLRGITLAVLLSLGISLGIGPSKADAETADFAVPGGWFYTQSAGTSSGYGFAVLDLAGVPFWTSYQELGGATRLGYPISHRFIWDGFPAQIFEHGVLQFRADVGVVQIVNVMDWLGQNGFDSFLFVTYGAAPSLDWRDDTRFSWDFVMARHFALLDASPAIRRSYFGSGADPVTFYGLPMSGVDNGSAYVIRAQRAIFQEWKQDTPWAKAGSVTVVADGDALIASGVVPDRATSPLLAPAAISLAGFPPATTRGGTALGTSPRAPQPPPDAPCPPYAPVQPYRPNCATPYGAPAPIGAVPIGPAPIGPVPLAPLPIGPAPIAPVPFAPSPYAPAPGPYPGPIGPIGPIGYGGSCLGDESIQFVPNPAPADVEFSVEVSSNRYTLGVGLAGPGSVRLREVVAGGKGTVWKFGVTAPRGTYQFVFTRDGGQFACAQGTVVISPV